MFVNVLTTFGEVLQLVGVFAILSRHHRHEGVSRAFFNSGIVRVQAALSLSFLRLNGTYRLVVYRVASYDFWLILVNLVSTTLLWGPLAVDRLRF